MPVGVLVTTSTRSAPATTQRSAASTYFAVGQAERGITTKAIEITSLADYERLLGGRVTYGALYDDIRTFFEEGGARAFVSRVVGPAATLATKNLPDGAGTPINTVRLDALSAGAWGASISYEVQAGTISGTRKLVIYYSGAGSPGTETYDNLATPAAFASALTKSAFVRGTDLGSATAAPNNLPVIAGVTSLTGGSDDRASITTTHYTTALGNFLQSYGAGAVSIPGQTSASVGAALTAHAAANRRLALTAVANSSSSSQAMAAMTTLRALTSGTEHVGLFWPNIVVPDGTGGTRTITPEGYVAACRSRAIEQEGPARAPAGEIAQARFVSGTEQDVSQTLAGTLTDGGVSPIRIIANRVRLYGWRSASSDEANYHLLTARDVLNYVAVAIEADFESLTWRTIDSSRRLFSDMTNRAKGILEPLRADGQLFEQVDPASGQQVDPGYRIDTGPAVNTVLTAQANIAKAAISVRPPGSAEQLLVDIAKVALSGSV